MTNMERSEPTKRMAMILAHAHIGLAITMAEETGIMEALIESDEPMTSQEIADCKNLKERYVRELLNVLVCADLIQATGSEDGSYEYQMPEELRTNFHKENLFLIKLFKSMMARKNPLKERFKKDGPYGLPYSATPESYEAHDAASRLRTSIEYDLIMEHVPGLKEALESGINVIEFGSGKGKMITKLAQHYPKSSFIGSDYTDYILGLFKDIVAPMDIQNLKLKKLDIMNVPDEMVGNFDFTLVNDVIHDLPSPLDGLKGLRKVLKTGAYLSLVEINAHSDLMENKKI